MPDIKQRELKMQEKIKKEANAKILIEAELIVLCEEMEE